MATAGVLVTVAMALPWVVLCAVRAVRAFRDFFIPPHGTSTIDLAVTDRGRVLGRTRWPLRGRAPGVRSRTLTLRGEHLVGSYVTPEHPKGHGVAALVIGGSE